MATFRYIVDDVRAAVDFYCKCFGFEVVQVYGDAMAVVSRGDLNLWLAGPSSSARKPLASGEVPTPGGWSRIVLQVEDLDATMQRLAGLGVSVRGGMVVGPGGRQVLCEDPSGNIIEVFE